jgi:hypothetical protein
MSRTVGCPSLVKALSLMPYGDHPHSEDKARTKEEAWLPRIKPKINVMSAEIPKILRDYKAIFASPIALHSCWHLFYFRQLFSRPYLILLVTQISRMLMRYVTTI